MNNSFVIFSVIDGASYCGLQPGTYAGIVTSSSYSNIMFSSVMDDNGIIMGAQDIPADRIDIIFGGHVIRDTSGGQISSELSSIRMAIQNMNDTGDSQLLYQAMSDIANILRLLTEDRDRIIREEVDKVKSKFITEVKKKYHDFDTGLLS